MLLKYFNSNRISVNITIPLIIIAFWIPSLLPPLSIQVPEASGIPLGRFILTFNREFRLVSSIIALLLVFVNGYLLLQLNTIHIFIPVRTQLLLLFYLILVISMNQLHQLTPALISSTLLILVFYRIFSAYKIEGTSYNFLDAGMLISLASMFYFQSLGFFFFLLLAMVLLRPFNWRELVYTILGLIIPYFILFSIYFLADIPIKGYFINISDSLIRQNRQFRLSQIIGLSYSAFFILISSYYMMGSIGGMKIHARKFYMILLWFFLFSCMLYLSVPGTGIGIIYYISVPLTYLFAFFFAKSRRTWINELLFSIFFLLLLWQRIN